MTSHFQFAVADMSHLSLLKTELFSVYEFTDKPQLDPHLWLEEILGKPALTWVCVPFYKQLHAMMPRTIVSLSFLHRNINNGIILIM